MNPKQSLNETLNKKIIRLKKLLSSATNGYFHPSIDLSSYVAKKVTIALKTNSLNLS